MRSRAVVSLLLGFGIVAACQGAADSDLFDQGAGQLLDGSSLADGASQQQTSSSSSGDPASSSSGDAATTSSSSSGAADAAPDAPPIDLDPTGVFCSDDVGYCNGVTPLCCAVKPGSGALGPYACKAQCLATETTIDCDDDDDCAAGEVCCDTNNPSTGVPQTVTCKAAAACPPTSSQTKMCDPGKPDTCAAYNPNTTCQPHANMAAGMNICIP